MTGLPGKRKGPFKGFFFQEDNLAFAHFAHVNNNEQLEMAM